MKATIDRDRRSLLSLLEVEMDGFLREDMPSCLLRYLMRHGDILLFGGAIRDLAIFGEKRRISDYDFVFDGKSSILDDALCGQERNKYGGYRVNVGGFMIDIWPIAETWAFKTKRVKFTSRESLLSTTITSWESIYFSLKEKKLSCGGRYFHDLRKGKIDAVLVDNPRPENILKRVNENKKKINHAYLTENMQGALDRIENELKIYSGRKVFEETDIQ